MDMLISNKDREILRRLFGQKMEIAHSDTNLARRRDWLRHDNGIACRPMILAEGHDIFDASKFYDRNRDCVCEGEFARAHEFWLRSDILRFERLRDDHVVPPWLSVAWKIHATDFGVASKQHHTDNSGSLASRNWEPALADLNRDFHLLRPRTFTVDREATRRERDLLEQTFGDIGPVVLRGKPFWTAGLTQTAIDLIGLENLMLAMYDASDTLHRLMAFLRDDMLNFTGWLEREGLLTLDSYSDYIGSGSEGHTLRLPESLPEGTVTRKDCWLLSESQETVGVSPDFFEEFIFPYQLEIANHYGLLYYGCCEPVHTRWHVIKRFPNLARVSVSPWCDQERVAQDCGDTIAFSRKPNPTLISTAAFDEDAIRRDIATTLTAAQGCRIELIMKDVHTLNNEPQRLTRWVELARETCENMS